MCECLSVKPADAWERGRGAGAAFVETELEPGERMSLLGSCRRRSRSLFPRRLPSAGSALGGLLTFVSVTFGTEE